MTTSIDEFPRIGEPVPAVAEPVTAAPLAMASTRPLQQIRILCCLDCRRALPPPGPRCGPCTALASLSLVGPER